MIIKKKIYQDVKIETQKFKLNEMISDKITFKDLIYKINSDNGITYFIMLKHKEVTIEEQAKKTEQNDNEIEVKHHEENEVGLKRGFNIKKPEPSKAFKKNNTNKTNEPKTEWKTIAKPLIEYEGVIYDLYENETSNLNTQTINLLSIKNSFNKKELIENNFEIKGLDKNDAKQKFGFTDLKEHLNPENIEVNLKEIFKNKKKFPITKIELNPENEYELQLAHSKNLRYKKINQNENKLTEIIEEYQSESNYKRFSNFFELI